MLIKKDKKPLFSISNKVFSFSNSLFNKKIFSVILKFLGILQIILVVSFFYILIALDKEQIKELLFSTAQKTYWLSKTLTNLPIKWTNNIASNHSILNLEIAPRDYQLLMMLKDDAIKAGSALLDKHKKKFSAVINYKNDKLDGKWTWWYEDGQIKRETNYKDDKNHGMSTYWRENSQKRVEGNYKNDKLDGKWTWWHENGQKWAEGNYKDDKYNGKWTNWYENGQIKRETNYKNGVIVD